MNLNITPLSLAIMATSLFTLPSVADSQTPTTKVTVQTTDLISPESTIARSDKSLVTGKDWMIASANPLASEAGALMLKHGGNAIDAMVATQMVLGLVEPQSSGLGGGAFLVYWDAKNSGLRTFDGRETAPLQATPQLFQDKDGKPMQFFDAVVGGRSVGTPGTVKLMWETHQKLGKLEWKDVLQPAITLAKNGFPVSERLAGQVAADSEYLQRHPSTKAYFFPNGKAIQAGDLLKNPAYAKTLTKLAESGDKDFYQGQIAQNIVSAVRGVDDNPGVLSMDDLRLYTVKERPAMCAPYHAYQVCGMGPPSSGALTLGQILGMLSHYPLAKMGKDDVQSWRLIGDASRLAFADRGRFMADPDFVPQPTKGLLDPDYLAERAELLADNRALTDVASGEPPWDFANRKADATYFGQDNAIEFPSTSHFSIVDKDRNVVSITTTIENGFGSRVMVDGFLLNNELTDFSFATQDNGVPIANRVEPGKRPRSSMAPTIVMKDGKPVLAIGSPGGSQIIGYVAKSLIGYLDWNLDLQQAINLPNMNNRFGAFELEKDTQAQQWQPKLEQLGFKVQVKDLNSGVQAIAIDGQNLQGAADPRREGLVITQ